MKRSSQTDDSFWHTLDTGVATSALLLTGLGVVVMFSTSARIGGETFSPTFLRHAGAAAIGVCAALATATVPLRVLRRMTIPFWLISLLFLTATFAFGIEKNGAQRWLALPGLGMSFQPVEFAKLATVLAVATVLSRNTERQVTTPRDWLPALLIALPPATLLLLQPDFGNAAILLLLTGVLLFAAGTPLRLFAMPSIAFATLAGGYVAVTPYAQDRITAFLYAWEKSQTVGFQLVQSFVAFARGGLTGVGLGNGRQKLGYLPEAHTDFILSTVGEELGLIGVLLVLAGFVGLLMAGARIARHATDRFAMLLAFGCTVLITLPAVINIAVVTGAVPTKGLTLPFLSYGRSSMLASALAVGFVLNVARHATKEVTPSSARGKRAEHTGNTYAPALRRRKRA